MTYMVAILWGWLVQIVRLAGPALPIAFLLLMLSSLPLFAQSDSDLPDTYPLLEEFDAPAAFDVTMPDKVRIEDGKVLARVQGEGEQYAARAIPAFSGNVRIRVSGQINDWENNCFVSAGIGDGLKSGIAIRYGYFGGGCPVNGPLVDAHGVNLARGTDGCTWLGSWQWVEQGLPYEATLTIQDGAAELAVAGVGVVTGTLAYDGVYSQLFVGETGPNISSNFCSVDIERVEVEPLDGALVAVDNLTTALAYPTQVDLDWTHAIPGAALVRIERAEAGRAWQEIAAVDPEADGFADNRVTCGRTYAYRVDIYTEDGRHTGHSNVATATTPDCTVILDESWEEGIDPERWTAYGDPAPRLVPGEGTDGSTAFEANGDGDFHSGVISNHAFDITSGLSIEFRMKGAGVIGEKYSSTAVSLTPCAPDDDLEVTCRFAVAQVGGSTESGVAIYGTFTDELETLTEPWALLNGEWHHYRMDIKPDGLVDFYRDDELKFTTSRPIDFGEHSLLHLHVGGKSKNGAWRLDDLRVSAPVPPAWYVKVVDEAQRPVANAEVFAGDQSLGLTSQAGMIPVTGLGEGLELIAVHAVDVTPSARLMHDGWSYVTNLTNIRRQGEELVPFTVIGPGEQRLVLQRDYPLILFNLLISVEWDATDAYLEELARAVKLASDHLFDLTDGQMAFGNVEIYSNGQHWADADIQISTKNIVRPHAYIGGILDDDTSRIMRIGRGWNGLSGNEGAWDEPEGYRTLIHEFGHYALYLYDEYVAYEFDDEGNVLGERPAFCPAETADALEDESVRASAMYDGYRATELSAQGVPGLWSVACEETLQYQYTGQSAWETLADAYADRTDPPRWRIVSPMARQTVLAGPNGLPDALPDWPTVTVHRGENPEPPRMLTVLDPADQPVSNAIVALYRQSGVQVIGQGLTDGAGQLAVFGANVGDMVRAATFDGGYAGDAYIGPAAELIVKLAPVVEGPQRNVAYGADRAIPHMRVIAEPSVEAGQIDLLLSLYNFSPNADLGISISEPGDGADYSPVLGYSPSSGIYNGGISFPVTERGMGRVRVFGSMDDSRVRLQSAYRLQRVRNDRFSEVYSDDGNFYLQIDGGSLPANEAFFVVMPPGAVPGPLPAGMTLIGDPYDVTASGALAALEKPAALALHYDRHLLPEDFALDSMAVYRWDPVADAWRMVDSELDEEQGALTGAIRVLGVYAILAPATGSVPAATCGGCLLHAEPGGP